LLEEKKICDILPFVPLIASCIDKDLPFNMRRAALIKKCYPGLWNIFETYSITHIREDLKKMAGHSIYNDMIRIILTPKGESWLREAIMTVHKSDSITSIENESIGINLEKLIEEEEKEK